MGVNEKCKYKGRRKKCNFFWEEKRCKCAEDRSKIFYSIVLVSWLKMRGI